MYWGSLSKSTRDESTNIFTDLFSESIRRLNPDFEESVLKRLQEDISLALDNEDLGEAFFRMLTTRSGVKLIDFNDFNTSPLSATGSSP